MWTPDKSNAWFWLCVCSFGKKQRFAVARVWTGRTDAGYLRRQPCGTLPDVPTKNSRILTRLGGCVPEHWHSTTPCIREVGIACVPVVEELIEELQKAEVIHLDETPWYEKGKFCWLWVAITSTIAVYHIGSRRKEELLYLITDAFIGWLVTDGYGAYSSYKKRQHCLAHLIRKAIALTQAVDAEASDLGQWLLEELRELMQTLSHGDGDDNHDPVPGRLKRVCLLGSAAEHPKLKALALEILRDWDAVVAFVDHSGLPPTNNEAERALRHAVIARRISYGTRTSEGSLAYSSLLSVIETCRLRKVDPWSYIAKVITLGRKGILPPSIPVTFLVAA